MPTGRMRPDGSDGFRITIDNSEYYDSAETTDLDKGTVITICIIFIVLALIFFGTLFIVIKQAYDREATTSPSQVCLAKWYRLSEEQREIQINSFYSLSNIYTRPTPYVIGVDELAKNAYVNKCK